MLAVIGLLPATLAAGAIREQIETHREGLELIRQVEEVARDVRYHAGRLNSFSSTLLVTKWSHRHHLLQIRSLVNDSMLAAARALAGDAHLAILEKNEAGAKPWP
jgi:hypothetical protein